MALVLGDKLDITFHRTINSSIQDKINKEIQKIKNVAIEITEQDLIVRYLATNNFDRYILKEWNKCILIPLKIAKYLNKKYKFMINEQEVDYRDLID